MPDGIEPSTLEEHPVVPERTEPWRPLTEMKRLRGMHSLQKRKKCATPWFTDCIENLGIQTSGAWWTACVKIVLIQQYWQPPNSCTARPAGECQDVISSCDQWTNHGTWSSPANGQFLLKHPLKEVHVKGTLLVDASSRVAVIRIWRTAPRQELLGNVSSFGSKTNASRIVVQVLRTTGDSHDRS